MLQVVNDRTGILPYRTVPVPFGENRTVPVPVPYRTFFGRGLHPLPPPPGGGGGQKFVLRGGDKRAFFAFLGDMEDETGKKYGKGLLKGTKRRSEPPTPKVP